MPAAAPSPPARSLAPSPGPAVRRPAAPAWLLRCSRSDCSPRRLPWPLPPPGRPAAVLITAAGDDSIDRDAAGAASRSAGSSPGSSPRGDDDHGHRLPDQRRHASRSPASASASSAGEVLHHPRRARRRRPRPRSRHRPSSRRSRTSPARWRPARRWPSPTRSPPPTCSSTSDGVYPVLLNLNGTAPGRPAAARRASCPRSSSGRPPSRRRTPPWPGCGPSRNAPTCSPTGGFADDGLATLDHPRRPPRPGARQPRAAAPHPAGGGHRAGARPCRSRSRSTRRWSRSSPRWPPAPTPSEAWPAPARAPRPRSPSSPGCGRWPPSTPSWPWRTATSTPTRSQAAGLARRPGPQPARDGRRDGAAASRRGRGTSPHSDPDGVGVPDHEPRGDRTGPGAGRGRADPPVRSARPSPDRPVLGRAAARCVPGPWPRSRPAASTRWCSATPGSSTADGASGCAAGRPPRATGVTHPRGASGCWSPTPCWAVSSASAEHTPGGPRLAEQRYLAELAVLGPAGAAG